MSQTYKFVVRKGGIFVQPRSFYNSFLMYEASYGIGYILNEE
jgi:hypothetical protein